MLQVVILLFALLQGQLAFLLGRDVGTDAQYLHGTVGAVEGALHGVVPAHLPVGQRKLVLNLNFLIPADYLLVDGRVLAQFLVADAVGAGVGNGSFVAGDLAQLVHGPVMKQRPPFLVAYVHQGGQRVEQLLSELLLLHQLLLGLVARGNIDQVQVHVAFFAEGHHAHLEVPLRRRGFPIV